MGLEPEYIDVDALNDTAIGDSSCQICSISLSKLSIEARQAHYDHHFREEQPVASTSTLPSPPRSRAKMSSPGRNPFKRSPQRNTDDGTKAWVPSPRENVFWHCSMSANAPENYTPGLIPVLKRVLLKAHAAGNTQRAMLCYDGMVHVATERFDMGWGCGYRNFLMACTALIDQQIQPLYFPLLDEPISPGVRNLQQWIENAWADGFDKEGARQLKHKLVNTKKWIGTAELYVAFLSRGIPAQLVDFPKSPRGPKALVEWVTNYFTPSPHGVKTNVNDALRGASPVVCTDRMPLVLQHQGHSRTIVGYEVNRVGETNLLIFDPSKKPSLDLRRAAIATCQDVSSTGSPSKRDRLSPSKVLHRLFQSHTLKRKRDNEDEDEDDPVGAREEVKRVRGGLKAPKFMQSEDAEDTFPQNIKHDLERLLDPLKTIKFFSLNQQRLSKNEQYQILWFPLEEPLEEAQRRKHKVVTSERVI